MTVTVHHGDSRDVLKDLADASIDSVVCDPPYALVSIGKRFGADGAAPAKSGKTGAYARASAGFMGQKWDTGETAFDPEFWAEVLRVLKPGAHLIAFSATRTYHRMACAIEDAGFEIRDQIGWLYGSGFPKSHNQSGEWQGWGSALKPAWEPIVLARKPLVGTIAANLEAHGTGALNIDGCRIGVDLSEVIQTSGETVTTACHAGYQRPGASMFNTGKPKERGGPANVAGRWPANVIHDGSPEVLSAFPETTSGVMKAGTRRAAQDAPGSVCYGTYGGNATTADTIGDTGNASRFFYSAKADAADRCGSKHPTVKPIDLMAYLCRLVTRRGGLVLDPFAGSGSTGMACLREGFDCILIEREAEYVADIHRRLDHVEGADTPLFADEPTLFDGEAA